MTIVWLSLWIRRSTWTSVSLQRSTRSSGLSCQHMKEQGGLDTSDKKTCLAIWKVAPCCTYVSNCTSPGHPAAPSLPEPCIASSPEEAMCTEASPHVHLPTFHVPSNRPSRAD